MPATMPNTTGTRSERDTNTTRVSVTEAARILDITPDSVRARIRRGAIDAERLGGRWFVYLADKHDSNATKRDPNTIKRDMSATSDGIAAGPLPDTIARELIDQLKSENANLWALIDERDRALEERSRELASERERSDILHREALNRIEALTAGIAQEPPSDAPDRPGATESLATTDDVITVNGASQDDSGLPEDLTAQWSDLTDQLIAELGMDPEAALMAAAADLGIEYGG